VTTRVSAASCLLGLVEGATCPSPPPQPVAPMRGTDLNGVAWPELCLEPQAGEEHFFIIGDWGGIFQGWGQEPKTADDCRRQKVDGVDDRAQMLVAEQMNRRARSSQPRYVINIGDNFYWGGVQTECGAPTTSVQDSTLGQWTSVFEDVYNGPGLDGKVWMGVLGNHDFGGYKFTNGWDQAIAYTWGQSRRWLTPALYWSRRVKHPDFSIDYIFMDSNVNDAFAPADLPGHNMCSEQNNHANATCGVTGPTSVVDCASWFINLWEAQIPWAEDRLAAADADWRVIVTHFPPDFRVDTWRMLTEKYDVDLIITGHRHRQEVHYKNLDDVLPNTAWVVSGGGGGICSELTPREDGDDDQYGFMDVTISRTQLKIESISHGGIVRNTTIVEPKRPRTTTSPPTTTSSITATSTSSATRTTTTSTVAHTVTATTVEAATSTMTGTPNRTRRGPFRDASSHQVNTSSDILPQGQQDTTSSCIAVTVPWWVTMWLAVVAGVRLN
jgi:hypothetical protein